MTTREDIGDWFDEGKREKATHLIVVCDTFSYEDYPVYAEGDDDCLEKYAHYSGPNMQKVMEVYDLRMPKRAQIAERRTFNLPKAKTK